MTWSVCILKSHSILTPLFSTTLAGLWFYHLTLPTKPNFSHSSKHTILEITLCLCLYSFCANILHSSIRWVIYSSLSPRIPHFSETSWQSIFFFIQFVIGTCYCAAYIVSSFKYPSVILPHVSSLLTFSVSLINLPWSYFSFHCLWLFSFFCFLAVNTDPSYCGKILSFL